MTCSTPIFHSSCEGSHRFTAGCRSSCSGSWLGSGADRRALAVQSVLAVVVLLVSYFLAPPPPPSLARPSAAVNINYIYGMDDKQAQMWMPPQAWLILMIAFNLLCLYVPTHFLLRRFFPPESEAARRGPLP